MAFGTTAPQPAASTATLRQRYLELLALAFAVFNSFRVLSYLPTLVAICESGDSGQHSVWTWGTWIGANVTMALWIYEDKGRVWTRAAIVSLCNASMCTATLAVILWFRI